MWGVPKKHWTLDINLGCIKFENVMKLKNTLNYNVHNHFLTKNI